MEVTRTDLFEETFLNRLDATYTASTPNRLRTLLPLTTVILYQVLPAVVLPAQVDRQWPPDTFFTAATLVPLDRVGPWSSSLTDATEAGRGRTWSPLW